VRPTETVQRMGEGRIKENDGGSEAKIYYKHNVNVTVYSQYNYNMLIHQ
jgi:hypothetical protein